MSYHITLFDENEQHLNENEQHLDPDSPPPLCLVHYFGATGQGPPPPSLGYIAERDGNLLILEFAPPPKSAAAKQRSKRLFVKPADALFLLLLVVSLAACIAAFRF